MRFGFSVGLMTSVLEHLIHILGSHSTFPRAVSLETVFKNTFSGRLLSMTRAPHKETKRSLRESFNHSMLQNFHSCMTEAVNQLCDVLHSIAEKNFKTGTSELVDITEELSITTFQIMTNAAFRLGMNREKRLGFAELVAAVARGIIDDYVGYLIRQALASFGMGKKYIESRARLRRICEEFVVKRVSETTDGGRGRYKVIMDAFLGLRMNDPRSAVSTTMEFAMGGSHTTTKTITWAIYEISCNPHVLQRLNEELSSHFDDRPDLGIFDV